MRKFFINFLQWISKHRKWLAYWALASFIFGFCFFNFGRIWVENVVLADSPQTQNDMVTEKATEWSSTFSFLTKVVNVLIYPMLLVAWKLVDNSLVYWEIFWFDAVLWQLWNIVKNLANFTLWFFFLYKIFKYLINPKENIKQTLILALVAWIWIQASRFIMAALIDMSTVLTYWIWWLPISVLKQSSSSNKTNPDSDDWEYNPAILKSMVYVDAKDLDTVHVYLTSTQTWWDILISECDTLYYKKGSVEDNLLIAPKMIYYDVWTEERVTDANRCHHNGQVYYFKSLYKDLAGFTNANKFDCGGSGCKYRQSEYNQKLIDIKWDIKAATGNDWSGLVVAISEGQLLQIRDAHTGWIAWSLWSGTYSDSSELWLDVSNKRTRNSWSTSRLQDILDGKSYVGVFTSLYSFLMNSWKNIFNEGEKWTFITFLNIFLTFWYLVAIWIPLIVVAVVFMIRICVLWVAIVLSPFIILASAFKEIWDKIFKWDFLEYFKLENLIPIIFSPAIVCFAVSMSSVLITIITWVNGKEIAVTSGKEILWWLITLNIWWLSSSLLKLVISALGVAITWFIVWAAVEASKIWKSKIIKSVKSLASDALWTIPIVPIPWKDGKVTWIWANTAFGLNGHDSILSQGVKEIEAKYNKNSQNAVNEFLHPEQAREKAEANFEKNRVEEYIKGITTADIKDGEDWREYQVKTIGPDGKERITTYSNLSDADAEKVIESINAINDENQRKKFHTVSKLHFWDKTWEFEENYKGKKWIYVKKEKESENKWSEGQTN